MNQHKDLPSGSQAWAKEVDALLDENKHLKEVLRRLCENAGIDYSNPKRGINSGATPSMNNPVGQKLSSLADVGTYDVLDKQVLSWSQQGQKWLPATLPTPSAGGTIDISEVSYSGLAEGYGVVTSPEEYTYTAAGVRENNFGPDYYYTESWTTGTAYIGAGNWDLGPGYALIELDLDGFNRPFVRLSAEDYVDGTGSYLVVSSWKVYVQNTMFQLQPFPTSARPEAAGGDEGCLIFDYDLGIPIVWNGTAWTNFIGTPV